VPEAETTQQSDLPGSRDYALGAVGFVLVFGCAFMLLCSNISNTVKQPDADPEKGEPIRAAAQSNARDGPRSAWCPPAPVLEAAALAEARPEGSLSSAGEKAHLILREHSKRMARHHSTKVRAFEQHRNGEDLDVCLRRVARASTVRLAPIDSHQQSEQFFAGCGIGVGSGSWMDADVRASRQGRRHSLAHHVRLSKSCPNLLEPLRLAGAEKLVEVQQCYDRPQVDPGNSADLTKKDISSQLKSTLREDIALRKKTFKLLCARWHPDKHLSGDKELATDIFQYIQEQKSWYLELCLE